MFPSLMHSFSLGFHIYYLCSSLAPIVGFVICDSRPICVLKIFTLLYMINHLPHFDIDGLIAQVDGNGSIIPAFEDELMEVDNFLSEPKLENMEDNVLGLELGNHEKGLKIEDFPCPDDLCQLNTGSSNVAYAWVLFSNSPFFKVI